MDCARTRDTKPCVVDATAAPELADHPQDVGERISRNGHLGHLKGI